MPVPEQLQELERRIAATVEQALAAQQSEIAARLRRHEAELQTVLSEAAAAVRPPQLLVSELHSLVGGAGAPAGRARGLAALRDAVSGIDQARTQADLLAALLAGAANFASRCALLLARPHGLEGWAATGFASGDVEALEGVWVRADGGWSEASAGRGAVSLDSEDCRALADQLAELPARDGVAVPLVLRERLAAVLYADRTAADGELATAALQTLAYVAAQALETLPLRQRAAPSLGWAREATDAPALAAWDGSAAAAAAAATSPAAGTAAPAVVAGAVAAAAAFAAFSTPAEAADDVEEPVAVVAPELESAASDTYSPSADDSAEREELSGEPDAPAPEAIEVADDADPADSGAGTEAESASWEEETSSTPVIEVEAAEVEAVAPVEAEEEPAPAFEEVAEEAYVVEREAPAAWATDAPETSAETSWTLESVPTEEPPAAVDTWQSFPQPVTSSEAPAEPAVAVAEASLTEDTAEEEAPLAYEEPVASPAAPMFGDYELAAAAEPVAEVASTYATPEAAWEEPTAESVAYAEVESAPWGAPMQQPAAPAWQEPAATEATWEEASPDAELLADSATAVAEEHYPAVEATDGAVYDESAGAAVAPEWTAGSAVATGPVAIQVEEEVYAEAVEVADEEESPEVTAALPHYVEDVSTDATVMITRPRLDVPVSADYDESPNATQMFARPITEPTPVMAEAAYPPAIVPPPPPMVTPPPSVQRPASNTAEIPAPVLSRPAPAAKGETLEVRPPEDLQGPGWAFATSRVPAMGRDPIHEEARRLARLLVSEIKLYNEELVEEGRRMRNIYGLLREDIDRSRQMYEERVDERLRGQSDYFQQELVRILAGGDASALGI